MHTNTHTHTELNSPSNSKDSKRAMNISDKVFDNRTTLLSCMMQTHLDVKLVDSQNTAIHNKISFSLGLSLWLFHLLAHFSSSIIWMCVYWVIFNLVCAIYSKNTYWRLITRIQISAHNANIEALAITNFRRKSVFGNFYYGISSFQRSNRSLSLSHF